MYANLSDAELVEATKVVRQKASDAPKSIAGSYSDAWAQFSNEWCSLMDEMKRRGLS